MTVFSGNIIDKFQIRKSKRQKAEFRAMLIEELRRLGWDAREEKRGSSINVVAGEPESAGLIYTAHYDTCAVLPFPNFITPRNFFWYLVYQLVIVLPMFIVAAVLEFLVLELFDAPDWAGLAVMYAVLIFFVWWLMDGPANKHTANDNTSGVVTLLEIAAAMEETQRGKVCLVFFDNEEKGLLGSSAFAKKHKSIRKTALVLNFDCVGDGDSLQFFPGKGVKKDELTLSAIAAAFAGSGEKTVETVRGFGFYPSDQRHFKRGVGVCALKRSRVFGWYMDRIHTPKDTVLDERNIALLRDGALRLPSLLSE